MKKVLTFLLLMTIFLTKTFSAQAENYLKLDFDLNFENITKKLSDGWIYEETGPNGINKIYFSSSTAKNDWNSSQGLKIYTNLDFVPFNNLFIKSKLVFIPQYADRFYQTVNDEHRMYLEKTNFKIIDTEIKYTSNIGVLRYFKGIGHTHWGYDPGIVNVFEGLSTYRYEIIRYQGDLFNLYKEQYDTERYLRVSGRNVPEGVELNLAYRDTKFDLVFGPEVIWGYKDGIYSKFNFSTYISNWIFKHALIFTSDKPEYITFSDPNERLTNYQYALRIYPNSKNSIDLGVLYCPFRLDKQYTYVEEVKEGEGDYGTKYKIHSDKTSSKDAFGTKLCLNIVSYKKFIEELKLNYTYLAPVAGNKQEFSISGWKRIGDINTVSLDFIYRKPIYGALPLIKDINGTIILSPRGPYDPFWVNWDNREATIFSFTYTFDPTPYTWFYKYQPNILEDWNLNPQENSDFAFAVQTKLAKYPTSTDRIYYWDENGKITWEKYGASGCWPTKDYVGEFTFVGRFKFYPIKLTTKLSFGDSLAKGSYAYTEENLKPITNFYKLGLSLELGSWLVSTSLGYNIWGPEEWFETFGESYDRLYQIFVSKKFAIFNTDFIASVKYNAVRETDKKYLAPEIADFDEIYLSLSTRFGIKGKF